MVLAAVQGAGAEQPLVTTLVTTDTGSVRVLTTGGSVNVLPPPEGQFVEGALTVIVSVDGEGGVGHPVGGIVGSEGPQSVMVTGGEVGGQDSPLGGGNGPQEVTVLVIGGKVTGGERGGHEPPAGGVGQLEGVQLPGVSTMDVIVSGVQIPGGGGGREQSGVTVIVAGDVEGQLIGPTPVSQGAVVTETLVMVAVVPMHGLGTPGRVIVDATQLLARVVPSTPVLDPPQSDQTVDEESSRR